MLRIHLFSIFTITTSRALALNREYSVNCTRTITYKMHIVYLPQNVDLSVTRARGGVEERGHGFGSARKRDLGS